MSASAPSSRSASAAPLQGQADPTRAGALALLVAVLDRHRPMEEALDSLPAMEPRDRAAAHRLAATVLRRHGTIDAVLEGYLDKSPPPVVMHVLRLGAAALLFLGAPPHAAVGTAVDLARSKSPRLAGLVNAVLRRVAQDGPGLLETLDGPRLDTPAWLWTAWGGQARAIARAHQSEAPLDLSLVPGAEVPEGGVALPTGSIRFPAGTRVTEIAGFAEGRSWVQDAAAALPVRLLNLRQGETVADLCAAPGGKTAQLAALGAEVQAIERDRRRIARLRETLKRLGLTAHITEADATKWKPAAPLDAVLLDAPCSATGTMRRHPDLPFLKKPSDIAGFAQAQHKLIAAAAGMLKPGGRLVYAVCSLQPEEGPARAAAAVETLPLRLDRVRAEELPGLAEAVTNEGYLRTHPGLWADKGGMDGFFAARFVRV